MGHMGPVNGSGQSHMAVSIVYIGHIGPVNGSGQSHTAVSIVYIGHVGPVNGSGQSHMTISIYLICVKSSRKMGQGRVTSSTMAGAGRVGPLIGNALEAMPGARAESKY